MYFNKGRSTRQAIYKDNTVLHPMETDHELACSAANCSQVPFYSDCRLCAKDRTAPRRKKLYEVNLSIASAFFEVLAKLQDVI